MDINNILRDYLTQKYESGMTDKDIADAMSCSQPLINALRNGKRSFANMRLQTILRLFPNAKINLGDITISNSQGNVGPNWGTQITNITNGDAKTINTSRIAFIRHAILGSEELCPKCALAALKILDNAEQR